MDAAEALALLQQCGPRWAAVGLPPVDPAALRTARPKVLQRLWGGMGHVYAISVPAKGHAPCVIAKRIRLPEACASVGDQRKKDSYEVEAAFYGQGHAERLIAAGCSVPHPLFVERAGPHGLTICMTPLPGRKVRRLDEAHARAALTALARLHALYWGPRADRAVGPGKGGGLQPQGCYWHLDTRTEEWAAMPRKGWEGRLRLAARALDERLKADPFQTVCHGDPKDDNMLFSEGPDGAVTAHLHDFQYCGKASPAKDLAYFLLGTTCSDAGETRLLRHYHGELTQLLMAQGDCAPPFPYLLDLVSLSYCDFGRFLSGWGWCGFDLGPRIRPVLDRLDGGAALPSEEAYLTAVQREFPLPASDLEAE